MEEGFLRVAEVRRALDDARERSIGDWTPTRGLGMGTPSLDEREIDANGEGGTSSKARIVWKDEILDVVLEVLHRCSRRRTIPEDVAFHLERVLHALRLVLTTSDAHRRIASSVDGETKGKILDAAKQLRDSTTVRKTLADAWNLARKEGVQALPRAVSWSDVKEGTARASRAPILETILECLESIRQSEGADEGDAETMEASDGTVPEGTKPSRLVHTLRRALGRELEPEEEELLRALAGLWDVCKQKPLARRFWDLAVEYAKEVKEDEHSNGALERTGSSESPKKNRRGMGLGTELGQEAWALWDEFKPLAFEALKEALHTAFLRTKGLRLPTIHGVAETAVGKVAFYLTRMSIAQLRQDLDSIRIERTSDTEDNRLQLVLPDVFVSIEGFRWQFQQLGVPWLDGRGEANVTVTSVELRFYFSYVASSGGLEATMEGASLNIPKVDLVLMEDAGPSWLYSFLTSVLNDKLRNVLQKELNEVICRLAVRISNNVGPWTNGLLALKLSPAVLELAAAIDPTVFDNEPVIASNTGQVHLLTEGISFLHFSAAKHSPKVVLFSSQPHVPNLYVQLANEFGKDLSFGFVSCGEENVRNYFGIRSTPKLVVFPQFCSCAAPSVYKGELTINPLRAYLAQFCFKPGCVVEVTPQSLPIFLQQPVHSILLLYFSQSSSRDTLTRLQGIAKMFESTNPPATVGIVEEEHEEILQALGRCTRKEGGELSLPAALVLPPPVVLTTNGMGPIKVYREEMSWIDGIITPRLLVERIGLCLSEPKKGVVRLHKWNLALFLSSKPYKPKIILVLPSLDGPLWNSFCEVWNKHGKVLCMGVLCEEEEKGISLPPLDFKQVPVVAIYQTPGARRRFFSRTSSHLLEESEFSSKGSDTQLQREKSDSSIEAMANCIKLNVPPYPPGTPFSNYVVEKDRLFGSSLTPESLFTFCVKSLKLLK